MRYTFKYKVTTPGLCLACRNLHHDDIDKSVRHFVRPISLVDGLNISQVAHLLIQNRGLEKGEVLKDKMGGKPILFSLAKKKITLSWLHPEEEEEKKSDILVTQSPSLYIKDIHFTSHSVKNTLFFESSV